MSFKLALLAGLAVLPMLFSPGTARAGDYCREFTENVWIGGRMQSSYGTACMQPDGSWERVSYSIKSSAPPVYGHTVHHSGGWASPPPRVQWNVVRTGYNPRHDHHHGHGHGRGKDCNDRHDHRGHHGGRGHHHR